MPQDFSHQNLQGHSFKGDDLRHANFTGADIRGADFSEAVLLYANFSQAQAGLPLARQRKLKQWVLFFSGLVGFMGAAIGALVLPTVAIGHPITISFGLLVLLGGLAAFGIGLNWGIGFIFWMITGGLVGVIGFYALKQAIPPLILGFQLVILGFCLRLLWRRGRAVMLSAALGLALFTIAVQLLPKSNQGIEEAFLIGIFMGIVSGMIAAQSMSLILGPIAAIGRPALIRAGVGLGLGVILALIGFGWVTPLAAVGIVLGGGIAALLAVWVQWQVSQPTDSYPVIRRLVWLCITEGGTNFGSADLTGADFTEAMLSSTDFREAKLQNVRWDGTQGVSRAWF